MRKPTPLSVWVAILMLAAFIANWLSDLPFIFGAGVVTYCVLVSAARIAVWLVIDE